MKNKRRSSWEDNDGGIDRADNDTDEAEDDEADIDVSMEIDASADDADAMFATTVTDFDPSDALGKLLAFVNQVRMSSEGVREYLAHACVIQSIAPIELRLWVRSRWGSLSHCLESTLNVRKVCLLFTVLIIILTLCNRQSITSVSLLATTMNSPLLRISPGRTSALTRVNGNS